MLLANKITMVYVPVASLVNVAQMLFAVCLTQLIKVSSNKKQ